MANTTTLATLRSAALDSADMTGSGFPDTTALNRYINAGLQYVYNKMVNSFEDYFHKEATFSLVSGQEDYDLPADHLKTTKVFYLEGTGADRRWSVPRFSVDEIEGCRSGAITSGSIQHWYVPTLPALALDADTVPAILPPSFEEYAILYAAQRLLEREESYQQAERLERYKQEIFQSMAETFEPRDTGEPKTVSDIYNRWSSYRWGHIAGRSFKYSLFGDKIKIVDFGAVGF